MIGVLSAGLIEFCLERRIRKVTSVIDTFLLPLMHSMQWPVRQLGERKHYGQGIAIGVEVDMTRQALRTTRLSKGVPGRALTTAQFSVPRVPSAVRTDGLAAFDRAFADYSSRAPVQPLLDMRQSADAAASLAHT